MTLLCICLILSVMQKDDPFLMMMLRSCSKDKRDSEQSEAKSILKKIETESKLSAKDEKWILNFQTRRPDCDQDEYQIDQGDMIPVDIAIQNFDEDTKERYDTETRKAFFSMDTVEDISEESKKKSDLLEEQLQRILCEPPDRPNRTAIMTELLAQMKQEEQIRTKNTSVCVYSLSFQTIHESEVLQRHVTSCERILLRQFFHSHFMPGQLQSIICALTKVCDCVVSMRTGGGKTMIFAIPALLDDRKTTIVFTPLRSLILDQMNEMKKLGIESGMLTSLLDCLLVIIFALKQMWQVT